jgi:hypothetical protein
MMDENLQAKMILKHLPFSLHKEIESKKNLSWIINWS